MFVIDLSILPIEFKTRLRGAINEYETILLEGNIHPESPAGRARAIEVLARWGFDYVQPEGLGLDPYNGHVRKDGTSSQQAG